MARKKRTPARRARKRHAAPEAPGASAELEAEAVAQPIEPDPWPLPTGARAALEHPAFLPVALGVGALLRVWHLSAFAASPFADRLQLDHLYYDGWARRIAEGQLVGDAPFFVDPLYAYFLSVVYAVLGHDVLAVRVLQAAMGIATAFLTAEVARRVLGSRALANLAGAIVAVLLPLVYYEAFVEKTALATLLGVATLAALFSTHPRAPLFSGLLAGLAGLARANLLVLVVVGVAHYLFWADGARPSWPPSLEARKRAGILAASALAVVSLATLHNLAASGELVLITANAGQNLYIGSQPENELGTYWAPDFVRPDPAFEEADFRLHAETELGKSLTSGEVSAYYRAEATEMMTADLGLTLERTFHKVVLAFHRFETPDNDNPEVIAESSPLLRSPVLWLGDIVPFALLGAVVAWRRRRGTRALAVSVALYVAGLAVFFVLGRFRAPLVPALAILGVAGGAWLFDALRQRSRMGVVAAVCVVAGLVAFTHYPGWMEGARVRGRAIALNNLGHALLLEGDREGAIAVFERAAATSPETVIGALRTLGELHAQAGDLEAAERYMREVLVHKPDSERGRTALARLLSEKSRRLFAEERFEEGTDALAESMQLGEYNENLRYAVGGYAELYWSPEKMIEFYSESVDTDPKPQTSLYFWAMGLARQGNMDEAIAMLERALETDPAHEMSQLRWGAILEGQGDLDGALVHFREAAIIYPDFREAHEAIIRVLTALGRGEEELAAARAELAAADPSSPRRYLYWGRYLLGKGRAQAAVAELEIAVRAMPDDAEVQRLLAEAREQAGGGPPGAAP